jgi:hypothetical protein
MSVKAKFQVQTITRNSWNPDAAAVRLNAVTTGSKENETWAKYTPSGTIEMYIENPDAIQEFALGKSFYLEFTEAPTP